MQQQKITQYAKSKYIADPGAGDPITLQKARKDIRVFLQNPNGVLGTDKKYDDRRALLSLREWGVDIIALPETNRNWKKEWLRNRWKNEVQMVWRHSKVFFTSIDEPVDPYADFVQGGSCLIIKGRWASRVVAHGGDDLGRWVWATLRGRQNKKVMFVTMYRPNRGLASLGPATVWSQQKSRMQKNANVETCTRHENPRKRCLLDFGAWADTKIAQGHKLILLTDANQSLMDKKEEYNLGDLMQRCFLTSAMEVKHKGQSLRSLD